MVATGAQGTPTAHGDACRYGQTIGRLAQRTRQLEQSHRRLEIDGDIEAYLEELKGHGEGEDIDALREAIQNLEAVSHKMAEAMYAEAADSLGDEV